jgi:hypothetical protein
MIAPITRFPCFKDDCVEYSGMFSGLSKPILLSMQYLATSMTCAGAFYSLPYFPGVGPGVEANFLLSK